MSWRKWWQGDVRVSVKDLNSGGGGGIELALPAVRVTDGSHAEARLAHRTKSPSLEVVSHGWHHGPECPSLEAHRPSASCSGEVQTPVVGSRLAGTSHPKLTGVFLTQSSRVRIKVTRLGSRVTVQF